MRVVYARCSNYVRYSVQFGHIDYFCRNMLDFINKDLARILESGLTLVLV